MMKREDPQSDCTAAKIGAGIQEHWRANASPEEIEKHDAYLDAMSRGLSDAEFKAEWAARQ